MDAHSEDGPQRLARKIRNAPRAGLLHPPHHFSREVRPALRRHAAAENPVGGIAVADLRQEGVAFLIRHLRPLGHETIFLPMRPIVDGVADAGVPRDADGPVIEPVLLDQGGEGVAGESARCVDGERTAAQFPHHARHVDAAAARVEPLVDGPHLPNGRNLLRLAPMVEGWIQREGDDIVHGNPARLEGAGIGRSTCQLISL